MVGVYVLWNLTGNTCPAALSTWNKNFSSILASPKGSYSSKRNWSFVRYPELEQALYERFILRRQEGKIARRIWFRLAARIELKRIYSELDANQFNGFCAKWGITLRAATNKAQEIPTAYHGFIVNWMRFNRGNSIPRGTQMTCRRTQLSFLAHRKYEPDTTSFCVARCMPARETRLSGPSQFAGSSSVAAQRAARPREEFCDLVGGARRARRAKTPFY